MRFYLRLPQQPTIPANMATIDHKPPLKKQRFDKSKNAATICSCRGMKLGNKWKEYQGFQNWEGLLDPLDDNLRNEILRYGNFVEAAYNSFDFDPSSPSYATSRFPKTSLFQRTGLFSTGYRISKNLKATSGIRLPRWIHRAPTWLAKQSSWIGYVAVCHDKHEISRLGRRDVVIAFRGTATCLEWLENLRATLTKLPKDMRNQTCNSSPMVESGFLSLYTSGCPSLREMLHQEISRLLQSYGGKQQQQPPLSFTITGHSLGAALAILAAYDIKESFKCGGVAVTVMSFGGPRVGNRSFRQRLEKQGTKVLRIVNSDDVITKVPGFVVKESGGEQGVGRWMKKWVEQTQWVYSEVGRELRLSSRHLSGINDIATCHNLKTYLHLIDGFVSSKCPFRATARTLLP